MEGSLAARRTGKDRPRRREAGAARRLAPALGLLAFLAVAFLLTGSRRVERSHAVTKTRRGGDRLDKRRIPPTIWQTWSSEPAPGTLLARQVRTLKARNPSHAYNFVDDNAQAAFMRAEFKGPVADAYFTIDASNGAARADLWRYCILYKAGGWYVDLDVGCRSPLHELHAPDDVLAFSYERARFPRKVPAALGCVAPRAFHRNVSDLLHTRSFFAKRAVAQNVIGAAKGSPAMLAVINRVVASLNEVSKAPAWRSEANCRDAHFVLTKRDAAKNHTWTWLRTIWLTGPFALTVALHEHVRRHPADAALYRTFDAHATGCLSSKRANTAMSVARPKYGALDADRPFLGAR
jgi:hypothetical protein